MGPAAARELLTLTLTLTLVWHRLEVGGKGHVHVQLRASPFPKLKQWSEWEREFALSMADRFGRLRLAGECS